MSDLDELDVPRPRPDAVAASVARRLDPWWGWVVSGALLALAGGVIGMLVLLFVTAPLGIVDKTLAAKVAAVVCLVVGEIGAFVVFSRWRRRRVARKVALIRDGALARAVVTYRRRVIDKGRSDLDIEVPGGPTLRCRFNVWFGLAPGREIRVLWLRGCPDLLAFDAAGRMYSGHLEGVEDR